ncbi:MAG: LPXTG cell wall anchor domain-containing protein [Oscillospiraceae bacterium]|nr:LPXTG cell wall anchor domain-containing protein [Oscillospiraceae bacterium]
MKKFLSFLLVIAVVMSFATIAMTVSADENELVAAGATEEVAEVAADDAVSVGAGTDTEASGEAGKIYFEKPSAWAGTTFSTHIWVVETGESFFGFSTKKERLKEEGGKLSYDLSILSDPSAQISGGFKSGVDYSIMFYDELGNETCGLMFNTNCVGDTAYLTANEKTFENTEDSRKHSYPIAWKDNGKKYGIPLQITSVGTIQGEFVSPDRTPDEIIKAWDKGFPSYPSKESYSPQSSARDHKTRLAEIKAEFDKMIAEGKVLLIGGGVYTKSASSNPGSSNGPSGDSSEDDSSDSSKAPSSYKTPDGKKVVKNDKGEFVDEDGNVVDASDVVEVEGSVSTGESTTYVYVGLGLMLAAAGVYFVTRKRKA